MLIKMMSLGELKNKIEQLQIEREELYDEIQQLKLEADSKALILEKEISTLKEEAEALRELIFSR
jgi:hypothetical protein